MRAIGGLAQSLLNLSGYSQGARGYRVQQSTPSRAGRKYPPPRPRRAMPKPRVTPSPRDSNRKASGKPGAVHPKGRERALRVVEVRVFGAFQGGAQTRSRERARGGVCYGFINRAASRVTFGESAVRNTRRQRRARGAHQSQRSGMRRTPLAGDGTRARICQSISPAFSGYRRRPLLPHPPLGRCTRTGSPKRPVNCGPYSGSSDCSSCSTSRASSATGVISSPITRANPDASGG